MSKVRIFKEGKGQVAEVESRKQAEQWLEDNQPFSVQFALMRGYRIETSEENNSRNGAKKAG